MADSSWQFLGSQKANELTAARLQTHWAAQIVKTVGAAHAAPAADYSHTAMVWRPDIQMLAGRNVGAGAGAGVRAALRISDLTLALLNAEGHPLATCGLAGKSLAESADWMQQALGDAEVIADESALTVATDKLPTHNLGQGAKFSIEDKDSFTELERWFANAASILTDVASSQPGAAPVYCWAHHFDIAALITLDPSEADPEKARSINVGLAAGDDSYDEPYFYVVPWPAPEDADPAQLSGHGQWHTQGWFGAVLMGSQISDADTAANQQKWVADFLNSALAISRGLLKTD